MKKQEGPIEVYERARSTLAKSLMDGIDQKNAAAEYYFSLLNLQQHGAIRSWDEGDWVLQKMMDVILKDDIQLDSDQSPDLGEGGGLEGYRETERALVNHAWRGRYKPFRPPAEWKNEQLMAGDEPHGGLMHGAWPGLKHLKPGEYPHFPNEHPFSSDNHPLLQGMEYGTPEFVETLASFYLRPDPNTPSKAEEAAIAERKWEIAHTNHAITNPIHRTDVGRHRQKVKQNEAHKTQQEGEDYEAIYGDIEIPERGMWANQGVPQEEEERDFPRSPFLGPLIGKGEGAHGAHLNDIYNHHFNRWKNNPENSEVVDGIKGTSTEEKEWNLRQAHMEHMRNEWVNGEDHIDDDGKAHSSKLGWLGYMGGMEFLTPTERTDVVNHMLNNGTDYDQNSPHVSMGRIKRNFMQRSVPEYLWWYRHPQMHGPNFPQIPEFPYEYEGSAGFPELLQESQYHLAGDTDESIHDVLLDHFNQMMGFEGTSEHTLMPRIMPNGKIYKQRESERSLPILTDHTYRMLAGYDENGNAYPANEHPIFGEKWEGPLIGHDEYKQVYKNALDSAKQSIEGKGIRNAAINHRAAVGPTKQEIEDHNLGDWYLDNTNGEHTDTLASHWHKPFNKGGLNRSQMHYLQALHSFLTTGITRDDLETKSGKEKMHHSHSLIGSGVHNPVTGELDGFTLRDDMMGMLASIHPPIARPPRLMKVPGETPEQAKKRKEWNSTPPERKIAEILNLHESSGPVIGPDLKPIFPPRSDKHNITLTASTNHPEFSQRAMRLSDSDRQKELGTKMAWDMDKRNLHTYTPFNRMEAPFNPQGHINPRTGSIISNRMATLLGRMHPPSNPMQSKSLSFKDISGGLVQPQHISTGDIPSFMIQQELVTPQLGGPSLEEDRMTKIANTIVEELIGLEEEMHHSQGNEEKMKSLINEYKSMEEDLRSLEQGLMGMDIEGAKSMHGKGMDSWIKHNDMMSSHFDAITNVAQQLREQMEKEHPDLYTPDDPLTMLSNALQTFRFANRYMMEMPHEHHGQHGLAYGESIRESRPLGEMLGRDASPFSLIAQGAQGLDARKINPNHSAEEVMELLGMNPEDPIHKKNAKALLQALDGKEMIPLKVSEAYNAGLIPNVEPIAGDLHDLADKGDDIVHGGLRRADYMFRHKGDEAAEHGLTWVPSASHGERRDMPRSGGSGRAPVKRHNDRLDALERANSHILYDPNVEIPTEIAPTTETVQTWSNYPIHPVGPNGTGTALDLLEGDRMNWGWGMAPDFIPRFRNDGSVQVNRSNVPVPTRLHSVPAPYLLQVFPELSQHLGGTDLYLSEPNMMTMNALGGMPTDVPGMLTNSDDDMSILGLTDPDSLLVKAGPEDWAPPIRPMHRIFSKEDLNALKGFSGDWLISRIPQGERLIVKKKGGRISAYDENGARKSLETGMPGSFKSISDEDFVVDGILNENQFQVLDILKHMGDDVSDLPTRERVKLLRAHYSSNENVEIPAPHNTRTTDEEGLVKALEGLKEEGNGVYLLRDAQSTYMKGERRHPKWVLLRSPQEVNLIVLDRRGSGPFSYRLGAGPLIDSEGLGNRAKSFDEKPYMDIGTVVRSDKAFNVGDIVNVGVDSVTQSSRKGRDVYTIQAQDVIGEGFGEGPASLETLSLLTKSHPPIPWPHEVSLSGDCVHVSIPSLNDEIIYKAHEWPEGWFIHSPSAIMGDMADTAYPIRLAESLRPYWSPVAGAMLKGLEYEPEEEKKEEVHESQDDAEPLIEPKKIKDTFHKPTVTKALEVALRALELVSKERTTWTGSRGMGFDQGTPTESPHGPTSLVNESTLPDWDLKQRPAEDPEKPWPKKSKNNSKSQDDIHEKVKTEEGDEGDLDIDAESATLSI